MFGPDYLLHDLEQRVLNNPKHMGISFAKWSLVRFFFHNFETWYQTDILSEFRLNKVPNVWNIIFVVFYSIFKPISNTPSSKLLNDITKLKKIILCYFNFIFIVFWVSFFWYSSASRSLLTYFRHKNHCVILKKFWNFGEKASRIHSLRKFFGKKYMWNQENISWEICSHPLHCSVFRKISNSCFIIFIFTIPSKSFNGHFEAFPSIFVFCR